MAAYCDKNDNGIIELDNFSDAMYNPDEYEPIVYVNEIAAVKDSIFVAEDFIKPLKFIFE